MHSKIKNDGQYAGIIEVSIASNYLISIYIFTKKVLLIVIIIYDMKK